MKAFDASRVVEENPVAQSMKKMKPRCGSFLEVLPGFDEYVALHTWWSRSSGLGMISQPSSSPCISVLYIDNSSYDINLIWSSRTQKKILMQMQSQLLRDLVWIDVDKSIFIPWIRAILDRLLAVFSPSISIFKMIDFAFRHESEAWFSLSFLPFLPWLVPGQELQQSNFRVLC